MADTIGTRIKKRRKELKLTQDRLAKAVDVSSVSVSQWESDITKPSSENLYKLSIALNCDIPWLLVNDDKNFYNSNNVMIKESTISGTTISNSVNEKSELLNKSTEMSLYNNEDNNRHKIDYLNVRAAAGLVGFNNSDYPEIISSLSLSKDGMLEIVGRKSSDGIFMINVPTDSMEPTIPKGSIVFIDTNIDHYNGDGIYAFASDGALFIKRIQRMMSGGYKLISDNDKYEIEVATENNFANAKFVGKFIKCLRIETWDL